MTLLFKIHYFLWYGAHTAIFGYESVYAQQYTNASTVQYGTLKMILPFIAVIVTPIVCSRADRKRSHRLYFTLALLLTTLTLFGYTFLPLTMRARATAPVAIATANTPPPPPPPPPATTTARRNSRYDWFGVSYARDSASSSTSPALNSTTASTTTRHRQQLAAKSGNADEGRVLWSGPWIFFCVNTLLFELALAVATCLSDSFAVLQAEASGTSFGQIILWGTFGWALSALLVGYVNQIESMPRLLPGILLSGACLLLDLLTVVLWPNPNDFKLDAMPVEAARSLTGSSSAGHHEPSDYQPANEANLINLGRERPLEESAGPSSVRERKVASPVQLLLAGAKGTKSIRMSGTGTGGVDETAVLVLPEGAQKGADPYANSSGGQTSKLASEQPGSGSGSSRRPARQNIARDEAVPAASGNGAAKQASQTSENLVSLRVQLKLFLLILSRRKTLARYLVLFVLSGFFMSMQWNYFFLYLERAFPEQFTLLSALSMVGQSLLGELPFFILSRLLIARLGRSHTLSVSLICMGLRFLVYRFLLVQVSQWCVFLADCLQGPTYGLFYVVMAQVGLEYSFCDRQSIERLARSGLIDGANGRQVDAIRLALRSTVQSIAFACYEGLGVGLGSLAGGLLLARFDFNLLWLSMAIAAISAGLLNSLVELFCREPDPESG